VTELHGVTGAPYATPSVRKKLPQPFQRPSIHASGPPEKRSWKDTRVTEVQARDTVAEFGIVAAVQEFLDATQVDPESGEAQTGWWRVRMHNVMGEIRDYPGHDRVYAFTKDPQ
jgi:hypothetical protein